MTDQAAPDIVRSRRAVLAAAAGGAAALAATAIRPASIAAVSAPMLTEVDNATTAVTGVTNSDAGEQAWYGHAAGAGNGVEGTSATGHGVRGVSTDTSDPTANVSNAGVVGVAGALGSIPANISPTGVFGFSDPSADVDHVGAGVWGESDDIGVIGDGSIGVFGDGFWGVLGVAENASGVGVLASTNVAGARALRVEGRAEFTRSGRATISAGKSSKAVGLPGCTTSTLVIAVLAASRSGRWVRAVVAGTNQFIVYLNTSVSSATGVNWIAFTNPSNHGG